MLRLKELRERKGLSQRQLGKAINLPQPRICEMENGRRCIRLVEGLKIAKVLEVEASDLICDE